MDSNSSSVAIDGVPLLFPKSVIPSTFSNRAIVSDVLVSKGCVFGPYPGNDAVEKRCNNWMQHVTSVTDYWEANMMVVILKNQLYFHCRRRIRAGTELIVWGGQKKIHLRDPSEWLTYKLDETSSAFMCQECDLNFKTPRSLILHINKSHVTKKMPEKNCKCPHCPYVGYKIDLRKHLVRHGINLYGNPLVINQNKAAIEIEDSESNSAKTSTGRNEAITENEVYNCKLCKETFYCRRQLIGHIGAEHKQIKSKYGRIAPVKKLDSNGVGNASIHSTGSSENQSRWKRNTIQYDCKYCEELFYTRKSRNQHIKTVHLAIQFLCSICKNKFKFKFNLKKHFQTFHNSQGYIITVKNGKIIQ